MAFDQIIKGTILPKVPLKELFEADSSARSTNDTVYKAPEYLPDAAQMTGANKPFVKIGGEIVINIETLVIDETGFIPTISMVFIDEIGHFGGDNFPKTNLIMNVYLKVGSEKLKPIRADFLITSIKSMGPRYSGEYRGATIGATYMVRGELYIPNLYRNVSKAYAGLNSKDALKAVCEELGLGFAENENAPNDKMTWINPNMSNLEFMQEIVEHAYQDDDSFFMGWIDKYYYFNYIEVNRQLKIGDLQRTFINMANPLANDVNQRAKDSDLKERLAEATTVNYLTTELDFKGAPNHVVEISMLSDQGSILKSHGYKKQIYYYDHLKAIQEDPNEKFTDFFMSPLRSLDRKEERFLIPEEESLADNTISKWINIDYGNTHPEWNAARLLNSHNLKELNKLKLKLKINHVNFQVLKGFAVPLLVTIQKAEEILKATPREQDKPNKSASFDYALDEQLPDEQLSDYYYVQGAKYWYDRLDPNGLYTELFLTKRDWKPSKTTD
jgi:hypothetical protein